MGGCSASEPGLLAIRCWKCNAKLAEMGGIEEQVYTSNSPPEGNYPGFLRFKCVRNNKGKRCGTLNYLVAYDGSEDLDA